MLLPITVQRWIWDHLRSTTQLREMCLLEQTIGIDVIEDISFAEDLARGYVRVIRDKSGVTSTALNGGYKLRPSLQSVFVVSNRL